jgi:peptide/nickel transport system ATP-binding protein
MYQGKVVEEGIPNEVIRNPKNEYTRNLIASVL